MIKFPDTFLYSISWEDSEEDKPVLNIKQNDIVLTLTGGGDNAFSWLLDGAKEVYCVDLNPAQYHLMELKKQTILYSNYQNLWNMFGEGKFVGDSFDDYIGKLKLSVESSNFWIRKSHYFKKGLYCYGSMGNVVNIINILQFKWILCNSYISKDSFIFKMFMHIYKMFVYMFCFFFGNTFMMWHCFGTPANQINMITKDDNRSLSEYIITSLDNVIRKTDIVNDNHYYYLIFNGRFSKRNCPDYLKEQNFRFLKENMFNIYNVNDSFLNILSQRQYNKVILMDHMDWMDNIYITKLATLLKTHLNDTGKAVFRSASVYPWFLDIFLSKNFRLTNISNHIENPYMDRINTYGSFWVIEHV